jgi:RHS repeat-associated protein
MELPAGVSTGTYTYAGTGYANPHAVTSIGNGLSTTTYAYDNNGNLTSTGNGTASTTYTYDYANRLTAIFSLGATTTFGYDYSGRRVIQIGTSSTSIYPFKWYSIASSTVAGARYSTTTEYIFNGDSLVATVDQQLAGGSATGTPQTRYIHPDHLGSTNVVTNASGTVVQTLDYYPYGSTRISSGSNVQDRKYIGQFSDQSGLLYLQARYQDPQRGQFLSQDPVFWSTSQKLDKPQTLNSYSYANGNPITNKDADGRDALGISVGFGAEGGLGFFAGFQMSAGVTLVYNPDTGERWLVPTFSAGGTAGALGSYSSYASTNGELPTVLGASGGVNISGSYSPNVKNPRDMGPVSSSLNINAGVVTASVQGAKTNSPTYSFGAGPGLGGSMSYFPVQTWQAQTYSWMGQTQSSYNQSRPGQQNNSQPANNNTGSGGGGGGSSGQLISLYQSLVSTLTAIVSALSSAPRTQ